MTRIAVGWEESDSIAVDICPYCSGPHRHTNYGVNKPSCNRGEYVVVNGESILPAPLMNGG